MGQAPSHQAQGICGALDFGDLSGQAQGNHGAQDLGKMWGWSQVPGPRGAVVPLTAVMSVAGPQSEWVVELVTRVLGHSHVPPTSCLTVPWGGPVGRLIWEGPGLSPTLGEHKYLFLEADANHWANKRSLAPARHLHKGCGGTRVGVGGAVASGSPKIPVG